MHRARPFVGACVARIWYASQVIFVDCDDCLYQNEWATAAKITTSIAAYTANLGVSEEKVSSVAAVVVHQ